MNRVSEEVMRVGRGKAALAVLASVAVLSACAGENLFSLAATVSETGLTVEITTPQSTLTKPVGDSILVEANVDAPSGASSVVYSGLYEGTEEPAYTSETANLNGLVSVTLTNYLRASPGQVAGTAVVIVRVTDEVGETAADSVTVTIN